MSMDIYKILYCSKNLIEGEQANRSRDKPNSPESAAK
jgi:hypothetical protein